MKITTLLFAMALLTINLNAQDSIPSNIHFWNTIETSARAREVWNVWTDVSNWKQWDTGLKDASIRGAFGLGATGVILSLEGRKSKFIVVEYTDGKSYTIKTKLPLGSLYVRRSLNENISGNTEFTHEVWFSGLSKKIFAKVFGARFRELLVPAMNNVEEIAKKP